MAEDLFFRLLSLIEQLGPGLSILAWVTVACGAGAMGYALRQERRRSVWIAGVLVGIVALVANLADYFITLQRSPDLRLEANPLWRNVVDSYGLTLAKWYGFTGKIFVSVLAAQMFVFYLSNLERLFPDRADNFADFLLQMGGQARTLMDRVLALFTVFAFFFAGMNLLYFYIAYTNSLDDPALLNRLPSAPVAVLIAVVVLIITFTIVTYRAYRLYRSELNSNSSGLLG